MGSNSTTTVAPAAPSAEETELIKIQTQLSQRQLAEFEKLQPFQQKLLEQATSNLEREGRLGTAMDSAISPEDQASFARDEFNRAKKLGPVQDELLQLQLEQLRSGGAATPEQEARIKAATDAGIAAGSSDIDASTQRGIGLISDELANARGLRLSDSPIKSEAALLAREGEVQKGSLVKNLRAAEASSKLNFPLAAAGVMSGINQSQQGVAEAARQFQAELRQRAFQNRLALSGQAAQSGIGIASIANTSGAIGALSAGRGKTSSTSGTPGLGEIGMLAGGVGGLITAMSDRRLKRDIVKLRDDPRGFGIYAYTIFGKRSVGVMADEVARVMPQAVVTTPSGFQAVHYGMLA